MKHATNITWHQSKVNLEDIERKNGHKGCVVWLTGLSGSGKSTIAVELEKQLFAFGCHTFILDGDNIRHGLNNNLGFSPVDREENIRRIGEVAKLFRAGGFIVITAFISPYKKDRLAARELIDEGHFIEVYVRCSLDECENRDPKGLYKKAKAGLIPDFTGISAPYEEPDNCELVVDTEQLSVLESTQLIIKELYNKGIIDH
ncbi:MAG: cysC [Ignavibacteria bacterium]|nr:cysC [Ignavibacteria bacterium]